MGCLSSAMATRITPAEALDVRRSTRRHGTFDRDLGAAGRLAAALLVGGHGRARRPDRIHHHGPCETSIYILSGTADYTWGAGGTEHALQAAAGDFIYIPAGEIHVEANASATEPLVVVLTRNCPDSHVVYLDGGADGAERPDLMAAPPRETLPELLRRFDLHILPEHPFPTDGWSGATFSIIERDDARFVLKRTSRVTDWIVRATGDTAIREAWIADRLLARTSCSGAARSGRHTSGRRPTGRRPSSSCPTSRPSSSPGTARSTTP